MGPSGVPPQSPAGLGPPRPPSPYGAGLQPIRGRAGTQRLRVGPGAGLSPPATHGTPPAVLSLVSPLFAELCHWVPAAVATPPPLAHPPPPSPPTLAGLRGAADRGGGGLPHLRRGRGSSPLASLRSARGSPPARGGARWGWLKRVLFSRGIHWREGGSGRVLGLRLGCVVGASRRSLGYMVLGGQGRSRGIMLGGRAATLPS